MILSWKKMKVFEFLEFLQSAKVPLESEIYIGEEKKTVFLQCTSFSYDPEIDLLTIMSDGNYCKKVKSNL